MVYRLDAGTVIDAEGNLVIENLYAESIISKTQAQGTVSGYISGGSPPNVTSNIIEKFSLSSDGNASDVGDLSQGRSDTNGTSSSSNGYTHGGNKNPPYISGVDTIDKFPFSVDGNATDVGNLTDGRYGAAGQMSDNSGYASGGTPTAYLDIIDKYSFAADGNATDVGDLTVARVSGSGQSSSTHGYTSGGGQPKMNIIDKFPFSVDANATDVGDLLTVTSQNVGQNSVTHGYSSGGSGSPSTINIIQKFPFSSDANSTDVGDLLGNRENGSGQSSTENGYNSGGYSANPYTPSYNVIEKFPFSSDANSADVGDMAVVRTGTAEQQV